MKEKVILAYSGGLDTTAIIPWLKENYDYDYYQTIIDGTEQEFYSEKGLSELVSRSKDTTENIFTFSNKNLRL